MKKYNKKALLRLSIVAVLFFLFAHIYNQKTQPMPSFVSTEGIDTLYKVMLDNESQWLKYKFENNYSIVSNPDKIIVLMYHDINEPPGPLKVPVKNFEEQMKYLKDNDYQVITLEQFYDYKINNKPLPAKPVIITFDDGYEGNYKNAFPILKKYNTKATIFIITDFVGRKDFLTWDMIKEMYDYGLINIESHTLTHPKLANIPVNIAEKEITESKKLIEGKLGHNVYFLSYPYGNYNNNVIDLTHKTGYLGAVVVERPKFDNRVDKTSDLYQITRIGIGGKDDLHTFIKKLHY